MTEKPRVLLVDDDEPTSVLVRALLDREFEVEIAADGVEAVDRLRSSRYHAVLLDIRMPHADGFHVLDHLQEQGPHVLSRVIVLTAAVQEPDLVRAAGYGVHAVVAKPFEIDALVSLVRDCSRDDRGSLGPMIYTGTGMILLLADLIQRRWLS